MATGPPPAESSIYDAKDLINSKEVSITPSTSATSSSLRLEEGGGGVWATGGNIELYKPIAEYEGAHRYDPQFEWEEEEERKLVRRVYTYFPFPYAFIVSLCQSMFLYCGEEALVSY